MTQPSNKKQHFMAKKQNDNEKGTGQKNHQRAEPFPPKSHSAENHTKNRNSNRYVYNRKKTSGSEQAKKRPNYQDPQAWYGVDNTNPKNQYHPHQENRHTHQKEKQEKIEEPSLENFASAVSQTSEKLQQNEANVTQKAQEHTKDQVIPRSERKIGSAPLVLLESEEKVLQKAVDKLERVRSRLPSFDRQKQEFSSIQSVISQVQQRQPQPSQKSAQPNSKNKSNIPKKEQNLTLTIEGRPSDSEIPSPIPIADLLTEKKNAKKKEKDEHNGRCHLCEWRGYITYPGRAHAEVKRCSCVEELCPKCLGEGGFEVRLESESIAWKICDCTDLDRRMELYRAAKIPARFSAKTLEAYAPTDKSQDTVRAQLFRLLSKSKNGKSLFQTGDKGILLTGPPGTGKTHLMVGFLRSLILNYKVPCRFQDFGLLLSEIRMSYSGGGSELDALQPLLNIPVLLIDDLGKGRNSKWELNIIDTLVSYRYNASRTTLFTTNYTDALETTLRERTRGRGSHENEELVTRDVLEDRVGDRIHSRLTEMCDVYFIKGNDYRRGSSNK